MSNPNIVQISSLTGKTNAAVITTTIATLVSNPSGSNQLYKISTLRITNANTSLVSTTVDLYRSGIAYPLLDNAAVNPNSPTLVITKEVPIFLEEGDSLRCSSNANVGLTAICSFEVIS